MAKRKPLPRISKEEKVKRLVRQDSIKRDYEDPRREPMAGRSLALSMMGTEQGDDPAKIEARARAIAKMRATSREKSKKALGIKEEKATKARPTEGDKKGKMKRGYDEEEFRISPGYFKKQKYDI